MKEERLFENLKGFRRRLCMNQTVFWDAVGVTQSGGSRYEGGRKMSKPVRELLRLKRLPLLKGGREAQLRDGLRRFAKSFGMTAAETKTVLAQISKSKNRRRR